MQTANMTYTACHQVQAQRSASLSMFNVELVVHEWRGKRNRTQTDGSGWRLQRCRHYIYQSLVVKRDLSCRDTSTSQHSTMVRVCRCKRLKWVFSARRDGVRSWDIRMRLKVELLLLYSERRGLACPSGNALEMYRDFYGCTTIISTDYS